MRVLQIIATSGPGGAESAVISLAKQLRSLRTDVVVASWGRQHYLFDQANHSGIRSVRLDSVGPGRSVFQLVRLLRSLQPDVVHSHMFDANFPAGLAGAACHIPTVLTLHSTLYEIESWKRRAAYYHLGRLGARFAAVSESVARAVAGAGIPAHLVTCVHNGVDLSSFGAVEDVSLRSQLAVAQTDVLIGMVANFRPAKDHALLIDAVGVVRARFPNVHVVLVGDGTETAKARLLDAAARVGLKGRVHLTGLRSDIPSVLRALDLFVLASKVEGLPISIIEAMAAGRAVVASDVGGVRELVSNGVTGLVVPPGNLDALADALLTLLTSPGVRQRMGAAGRERAEAVFGLDTMARAYMRLYEDCLGWPVSGGAGCCTPCSGSHSV